MPIAAFVAFAGPVCGADPAGCRLPKGLYEDWVALERPPATKPPLATSIRAGAALSSVPPAAAREKRAAIRRQYEQFVGELSRAGETRQVASVQTCCNAAAGDQAGLLLCQLVSYLAAGRNQSTGFLLGLQDTRRGADLLRDLDTITSTDGDPKYPKMFLPDGPAGRLLDELFLLVLDGNAEAVARYFKLTSLVDGELASRRDQQIQVLVREGQAVIVEHWSQLRRYKQQLRAAMFAVARGGPPEELQRLHRAIKVFCAKDNPDCREILETFGVRN